MTREFSELADVSVLSQAVKVTVKWTHFPIAKRVLLAGQSTWAARVKFIDFPFFRVDSFAF